MQRRGIVTEWFRGLRVAQKLMLIGVFFVIPDCVMLYLFITAINANIEFAQMEQKGNQYQRPLESLLELIPQHQQLARTSQSSEEAQAALAQKVSQIDAAFHALQVVDARIGVDLQFTDEGLAKRHREHFRAPTVQSEWQDVKMATVSASELNDEYAHLVADVRTMIKHSGDISNLILDPDLDSYYLMDTTLLALPQTQERLAEVIANGQTALNQPGEISAGQYQFAVYAQLLRESDVARISESMAAALREDANFYSVSPGLQSRVPPALRDYVAANETFINLIERIATGQRGDMTADQYVTAGNAARDTSFKLWNIAAEEMDGLLQKRIHYYQGRRARSLLVAAAALFAAISFVNFITRSISGPLQQQAAELQSANTTLEGEIAERKRAEMELRHSETQLATAQKIAQIGSWDWDVSSGQMSWSDENYHIHGFAPHAVDVSYESALQFVHPEDRSTSDAKFRKAVREKKGFSFEQRVVRQDGETRILHQRGDVVIAPDGSVINVLGTAQDITERKKAEDELDKVHNELMDVSRRAGMAEVATGVLHNVGNVLNSVNVSAELLSARISKSRIAHLAGVATLLKENAADMANFVTTSPQGKMLPGFIIQLAERLGAEQSEMLREVEGMGKNISHIKEIVAVQQSYAKVSGVIESLSASSLVEDALAMNGAAFERHGVDVIRDFAPAPLVRVDKHKVLQILINVIRNAKYAVSESSRVEKTVTVRIADNGNGKVGIIVADNGIGIARENLARIFAHGFTTKKNGHGFGLHSSALAAREMGGSLLAHSDGPNQGATFTLELPVETNVPEVVQV